MSIPTAEPSVARRSVRSPRLPSTPFRPPLWPPIHHVPHQPRPTGLADGTVVRLDGGDALYLVHENALRHIPDEQTYYLGGYNTRPVVDATTAQVADMATGDPLPDYPWVVATAEFWSEGRGHHVLAHASLNLKTGQLTGTITATNYVFATGFKSGTLFIPVNAVGDPVRPGLPGIYRVGVDARWFGSPVSRTVEVPDPPAFPAFNIGADAAADVRGLVIMTGEDPNSLKQALEQLVGFADDVAGYAEQLGKHVEVIKGIGAFAP